MRNFVRKVLEQGSMLAVYHRYANPVAYSDQLDGLAFNLAKTAPPQPKPLTDEQRESAFVEADNLMDADYRLPWRMAILKAVEAAHNIGAKK